VQQAEVAAAESARQELRRRLLPLLMLRPPNRGQPHAWAAALRERADWEPPTAAEIQAVPGNREPTACGRFVQAWTAAKVQAATAGVVQSEARLELKGSSSVWKARAWPESRWLD